MGPFTNLDGTAGGAGFGALLRWKLGIHRERRPRTPATGVDVPIVSNDGVAIRAASRDALTWIGHASFLVQLGGVSALIDPIMSDRIGGLVPRNAPVGLGWSQLPPISVVMVTHNHRDHMDAPTLEKLGTAPVYVVPRGLGRWFARAGLERVIEMDWWQTEQIEGLAVTFVPSQHWSRRGLRDANRSLWGGYVVSAATGGGPRVYHSGDTAWFDGFAEIGERCGPIEAAMLPIGAYAPRWFMRSQHMDPADAVRAFVALGARRFVAMHWGTFKLTDEDLGEPPILLRSAWAEQGLAEARRAIPAIGQTLDL